MRILALLLPLAVASAAVRGTSRSASRGARPTSQRRITSQYMSTGVGAVGSLLTNNDLAIEALEKFGIPAQCEMVPTTGGVNNIVQYITLPSGEKQLLRIYNNGMDTKRVTFEHEILRQLNAGPKMSFQVGIGLQNAAGVDDTLSMSQYRTVKRNESDGSSWSCNRWKCQISLGLRLQGRCSLATSPRRQPQCSCTAT
jgi:hypothetical protein